MKKNKIKNILKTLLTIIIIQQTFISVAFSQDEFEGITEHPIIKLTPGMVFPGGQNVQSLFNSGFSFTASANIPNVIKIKDFYLNVGLEVGFYSIQSDYNNLIDIPILANVGFENLSYKTGKFKIIPEIDLGLHIQSCNNQLFNKPGIGFAPGVGIEYKINKELTLLTKLKVTEIITSESKTQEWVDLRLGLSYTILDQSIELHKSKPMYK